MNTRIELYQLVTPLAGLGIWKRNLVTGAYFWNNIVHQLLEVEPDYHVTLEEAVNFYKEPQKIRDIFEKAMQTGQPQGIEAEIVTAKGNNRWLKVRVAALLEEGKCVELYGTLEDITEEVTMRHLLQEREQRFSQAFNHAPIGMALVSLKGEWIKVNKSLSDMLGYDTETFLNHTFQEFTHQDDLESDLGQLRQLMAGEISTYSMEKRYCHQKGHLIWALLNVSLVRDEYGQPLYFVSQIKDISEQKRNAEIITKQNNRLLNFAHIVSHNLRSHTGNIYMLARMIEEENDPQEKESMLTMLKDNAQTLLETLSHLNEVVNTQHGNHAKAKQLNLLREVKRVTDILSPSLKESEGNVCIDIKQDIVVDFDPAYLESILINLIGNSIKYRNPMRKLHIAIEAIVKDHCLVLNVRDNGLGIDMDKNGHKLFGLYETFHGHPDARGVGLFLVKSQVEAMGGKINVSSKPGEGTCFSVEINRLPFAALNIAV